MQKNVILLTLDATRKDVFGIYGNTNGLTPFIDSLKNKSLIFNNCQSIGPYTQASFPGILTSSYYLDYGLPKGLAQERTLISEPLKEAGIITAGFHSNPYCSGLFGWNRGWDVFYDSMEDEVEPRIPYVRGPEINKKASSWISSYKEKETNKPFFLWVHYMDIHEPYMPEKQYIEMVDPSLDINEDEMYEYFENTLLKRDVSDEKKVELLKKLYDIHVREVDTYVRELFEHLEEKKLLDDTVIIITSDHGDEFVEHGGLSHDHKLYRELIDVPLIIVGAEETGESEKVVSTVDIPPTILHLFDKEKVPGFKGQSLLPLDSYVEKGAFGEAIDQKSKRGGDIDKDVYFYREQEMKIIYQRYLDNWELFNLSEDPTEQNNIATSSSVFNRLKEKLLPMVRRWEL